MQLQGGLIGVSCAFSVIGDEILKGQVKDTNSHFILKHLHSFGVRVPKVRCHLLCSLLLYAIRLSGIIGDCKYILIALFWVVVVVVELGRPYFG